LAVFAGNVLSNAAVGLMAVAVMFIVALVVFNVNMRGDYLSLAFCSAWHYYVIWSWFSGWWLG
jgi:hypothetical protein